MLGRSHMRTRVPPGSSTCVATRGRHTCACVNSAWHQCLFKKTAAALMQCCLICSYTWSWVLSPDPVPAFVTYIDPALYDPLCLLLSETSLPWPCWTITCLTSRCQPLPVYRLFSACCITYLITRVDSACFTQLHPAPDPVLASAWGRWPRSAPTASNCYLQSISTHLCQLQLISQALLSCCALAATVATPVILEPGL